MTLCANSSSIVTFSSHRPKCPCCLACYLPSISQLHSLHFHSFNRMRCIGQTNSLLLHAPVHPLTSLIFDTVCNPTSFTAYGKNTHTHEHAQNSAIDEKVFHHETVLKRKKSNPPLEAAFPSLNCTTVF